MKIGIALSGGIDSTAAAYLLKNQGFEVIGLTFKFFKGSEEVCERALKIAERLDIPCYVLDLERDFKEEVISYFIATYQEGKTPNPCAICNKKIKFGKAMQIAFERFKLDKLATGHYVKIEPYKGELLLSKGKDLNKDQSYFLALIDREVLPKLLFPLGTYTKEEVKKLVLDLLDLVYRESQDVCFLRGKTLKEFLSQYLELKKGPLIYKDKIVGYHQGFYFFTVGQRKGLRLALGKPVYVTKIDPKENKVILGEKADLLKRGVILENLNLHLPISKWTNPFAQIRYRTNQIKIKDILIEPDRWKLIFENPVVGITPGQVCVFYEDNHVLGGGIIVDSI